MKVLQILPTLSAGGAEGFVTNLGVSLAGLGTDIRFFLMAGVRGERGRVLFLRLKNAGIEVVGTKEHNVRSPMNLLRLIHLIRSWRPDIVQANLYAAEVLGMAAKLLTIGNGTCFVRRLASTEQSGYHLDRFVRMMDHFYRQTIACSPAVAEAYRVNMGANHKSELVTIANGGLFQDDITSTEEKLHARKMLNIPEQAFVVAHIGRMFGNAIGTGLESEPKAHDILLKAFAKAFRGLSDSILLLVGDGPLRSELEALARDLGIAEQTRFLGQQPEPWLVLKAADMFCFPSRYEGFPNVLPEAASCGLPILASEIPEIRSMSQNNSWLLKPVNDVAALADGLREIAKHKLEYSQIACKVAPQVRECFSMAACARCYMDEYESILKKASRYKHM